MDLLVKSRINRILLLVENTLFFPPLSPFISNRFLVDRELFFKNYYLIGDTTPPQIPMYDFDTLTIPTQKMPGKKFYPYGIFYTDLEIKFILPNSNWF
jgi:hypothetical protein